MARLVWGSDLYKGFKLNKNELMSGAIDDILPFQMLTADEKTLDWVKAVADYYETAGWNNVERRASKIQRNFWMRYGKLNQSDYIINPENNLSAAIGMIVPPESQSPLEQFYPLAPNFVDVLRGEFIKRDNTWTIEAVDERSIKKAFEKKEEDFKDILMNLAQVEKQAALAEMGLTEEVDPETYQQEMQAAMQKFTEVEMNSRSFRTEGVKWAEKVLKVHERRYNLHELEPDAFESGLITDSEFWHIDLLEDDFKLELLNPKWCDYHKGPNVKYVSDGDYFLWFDWMSAGDIVNKLGRRMKEEDILRLKEIYVQTANLIVPDYLKSHQGSYYDRTKSWEVATDLNPVMNDVLLGKELAYNYMRSPNFDHNIDTDIFSPTKGRIVTGHPQMFRVMRLYWRSMKRIGWLTKINKDGSRDEPDWVDENYKVTIEPKYDNSRVKEKTKDNLIYGEHIDWTWVPDWRHVIKISPNQKHTFWLDSRNKMSSIYIDGGPCKFQFKGRKNPFDSLPPIEGCIFSHINTDSHSFIDRIRPTQILYNICMNKVPKKFLDDFGNKVTMDRRSMSTNSLSTVTDGVDPLEAYEDKLRNSTVLDYTLSKESLEGLGQPALPQVLALSTIADAQMYFRLAQEIKMEAGEIIGISRQRLGKNMASDTATSINQGITYSETQTEKYFEQHANLMQRVRQRMLEATQYYTTFNETSREMYMNDREENIMLAIEGTENLLAHYNIHLQSTANVRSALQKISAFLVEENTLPIRPSSKIEAIVSNSIPKIMSVIRESEFKQDQMEREQREAEMQMEQQRIEAQQQMQAEMLAREERQKELDRQTDIEIATIRALGGVQTDSNTDGETDAQANLDAYFKQQEILEARKQAKDQLNMKRQIDTDKMLLEREKSQRELEKEKIKGEFALKVAKENKTNAELRKKK